MEKVKAKMGRPPVSRYVYKPEYCEKLVEMGKKGETVAMFCRDVGIYKDLFYEWVETYLDFKDAKKKHDVNWEANSDQLGVLAQRGEIKGFALGVWIWNRKNKLKERDSYSIEQANSIQPVIVELSNGNQLKLEMKHVAADQITPTSE